MVLTVSFKDFPNAVKLAGVKDAFLAEHGKGSLVTAAAPEKNLLVTCLCDFPLDEAEADLKDAGLHVHKGAWAEGERTMESIQGGDVHVAGVAYQSRDSMPGLWMDAFPSQPTPQIVLRAMFDELRSNDELGEISFEEFLKLAKPNVVILSPGEITSFLRQKDEC